MTDGLRSVKVPPAVTTAAAAAATRSPADEMGERAVDAHLDGDVDEAANLYETAIDIEPMHRRNLCNCALFTWKVKKDSDRAAALFKAAVFDPGGVDDAAAVSRSEGDREAQASALSLYALFVDTQWEQSTGTGFEGRDAHAVAVERLHARALRADPTHAVALGRYARFAWQTRRDNTLAAALFERALKVAPEDPRNLALSLIHI